MSNIVLAFENAPVTFTSEAYLNATQIAKHFNKRVQHYLDNERTQEYIEELSKAGNPALDRKQLVIVKKGGKAGESGTWLHPKLTIDFARWLSARFAIWCDEQIEKILHGNRKDQPKLEYATKAQREPLVKAVRRLVKVAQSKGRALGYDDAHSIINLKLGVASIEALTAEQIPQAMTLVGEIMEKVVLEGEFIARGEAEPHATPEVQTITPKQKQQISEKLHQAFSGWCFTDGCRYSGYNALRVLFNLQNIEDLPADDFQKALDAIDVMKTMNFKFLSAIVDIRDDYMKNYLFSNVPWTPDLKRKWAKIRTDKLPGRPDWVKIAAELRGGQDAGVAG